MVLTQDPVHPMIHHHLHSMILLHLQALTMKAIHLTKARRRNLITAPAAAVAILLPVIQLLSMAATIPLPMTVQAAQQTTHQATMALLLLLQVEVVTLVPRMTAIQTMV